MIFEYLEKINEFTILMSLIIVLIFIFISYKYWLFIKNEKTVYRILVIATIVLVLNFYPVICENKKEYYKLFYNLSLSYVAGFIFYCLTTLKTELNKKANYYYFSINYINKILSVVIKEIYLRRYLLFEVKDQFSQDNNEFIFSVPFEKVYGMVNRLSDVFFEEEAENFKEEIEEELEKSIKIFRRKIDKNNKNFEKLNLRNKGILEHKNRMKNEKHYKTLDALFKSTDEFSKQFFFNLNLLDLKEISDSQIILDLINQIENKKKLEDRYVYFFANFKFYRNRLLELLKNQRIFLKKLNRYIPEIHCEITLFRSNGKVPNIIKKEIFTEIGATLKNCRVVIGEENWNCIKVKKIILSKENINDYFLAENNKKYYFENLREINKVKEEYQLIFS